MPNADFRRELRRIPIPRTTVNKGKRKGRGQLATATLLGALARYRSPLTRWCTFFTLRIMAARAAPTLSGMPPPVASRRMSLFP
jgi:hypothetical protein